MESDKFHVTLKIAALQGALGQRTLIQLRWANTGGTPAHGATSIRPLQRRRAWDGAFILPAAAGLGPQLCPVISTPLTQPKPQGVERVQRL